MSDNLQVIAHATLLILWNFSPVLVGWLMIHLASTYYRRSDLNSHAHHAAMTHDEVKHDELV